MYNSKTRNNSTKFKESIEWPGFAVQNIDFQNSKDQYIHSLLK